MVMTVHRWFANISIHKALTGLDHHDHRVYLGHDIFQSTRPSRASTQEGEQILREWYISIHKALTGLDVLRRAFKLQSCISIHKALTGLDNSQQVRIQV